MANGPHADFCWPTSESGNTREPESTQRAYWSADQVDGECPKDRKASNASVRRAVRASECASVPNGLLVLTSWRKLRRMVRARARMICAERCLHMWSHEIQRPDPSAYAVSDTFLQFRNNQNLRAPGNVAALATAPQASARWIDIRASDPPIIVYDDNLGGVAPPRRSR